MKKGHAKPEILVVDNDLSYRDVLTEILSEQMTIYYTDNYEDAIDIIGKKNISFILTELKLPGSDIVKFITDIKQLFKQIHFAVITAHSDYQLAINIIKMGAIDIIPKPFSIEDIALLIEKYRTVSVSQKIDYDLLDNMIEEKRTFALPSSFYSINPFIYELIDVIKRFPGMDSKTLFSIRLSIYEMIINAFEHGNLDVDYATKKHKLESGDDYLEFLTQRSREEQYASRQIIVNYHYIKSEISFTVIDEGKGFDVKSFLEKKEIEDIAALHGRGIFITKVNMDQITYNDIGNQVTLTKKIN